MSTPSTIFISYRRDDTAGHVGRLYDALSTRYGARQLFVDIDHIGPGEDFVQVLDQAVSKCAVLLVIIGRRWVAPDDTGHIRLRSPNDFVRLEVAAALRRNQIRVIPVLMQGAQMPAMHLLPVELHDLTRRQAVEISDTRWKEDVARLTAQLDRVLSNAFDPGPRKPLPKWVKWSAAAFAALMVGCYMTSKLTPFFVSSTPTPYSSVPNGGQAEIPDALDSKAQSALSKAHKWRSDAMLVAVDVKTGVNKTGGKAFDVVYSFVSPSDHQGLWIVASASAGEQYIPTNSTINGPLHEVPESFLDLPAAIHTAKNMGMSGGIDRAVLLHRYTRNRRNPVLVWAIVPSYNPYSTTYYVDGLTGAGLSSRDML